MRTLILYYSRTGTTKVVADTLAKALNATVAEIQCRRYSGGWFRYLLAGYDSVKGRLQLVDVPELRFQDYDLIVLGTPIWTSYPAIPLRSFLSSNPDLTGRVALFLTYGGHSAPQKAIEFVSDLLPVELEATVSIAHDTVVDGQSPELIADFVRELRSNM